MNITAISSVAREARPHELLSFVSSGANLWAPARTGHYATDNAQGRAYAAELLNHITTLQTPSLLGHVCRAISEAGEFDGVEVGFFHELAAAGMRDPSRRMCLAA